MDLTTSRAEDAPAPTCGLHLPPDQNQTTSLPGLAICHCTSTSVPPAPVPVVCISVCWAGTQYRLTGTATTALQVTKRHNPRLALQNDKGFRSGFLLHVGRRTTSLQQQVLQLVCVMLQVVAGAVAHSAVL